MATLRQPCIITFGRKYKRGIDSSLNFQPNVSLSQTKYHDLNDIWIYIVYCVFLNKLIKYIGTWSRCHRGPRCRWQTSRQCSQPTAEKLTIKNVVDINDSTKVIMHLVNREGGVVGFDDGVGDLGAGHDAVGVHDPVRVLLADLPEHWNCFFCLSTWYNMDLLNWLQKGAILQVSGCPAAQRRPDFDDIWDLGDEEGAHAGAGAAAQGVGELEALQAVAPLRLLPHHVQHRVDQLGSCTKLSEMLSICNLHNLFQHQHQSIYDGTTGWRKMVEHLTGSINLIPQCVVSRPLDDLCHCYLGFCDDRLGTQIPERDMVQQCTTSMCVLSELSGSVFAPQRAVRLVGIV